MMRRGSGALSVLLIATACGGSLPGTTAHTDASYTASSFPDAAHEAGAESVAEFTGPRASERLADIDRQALLHWQRSLVKRCEARDAVGMVTGHDDADAGDADADAGDGVIDLAVLRAQLQQDTNSAIPTLATSRERVIFGSPRLVTRTHASAWNVGNARVSTTLAEGLCTVRVDDGIVYRGFLAEQVPMEARLPEAGAPDTVVRMPDAPRAVGRGYVALSGRALWDAMQQATHADAATADRVAATLGVASVKGRRLFPISKQSTWPSAMQMLRDDDMPWFSQATPDMMGTADGMAALFAREDVRTRLRRVLRATPWPTPQAVRAPAPQWLTLEAAVQVTHDGGAGTHIRLETPRIAAALYIDPYMGSRCLQDRAAMLSAPRSHANAVAPSCEAIAEPCAVFDDTTRPHGYTDGVYMDLLPQVLGHVRPGADVDWRGWDAVLLRVAFDLQNNRQDIAQALDPRGQSPVIDRLGDAMAMLDAALSPYPHLRGERAAVAHWLGVQTLRGNAEAALRPGVFAALDKAFSAFPDAARLWLARMETGGMPPDAAFATVQSMTPGCIQLTHQAVDVATRYHDTWFLEHVYADVLRAPCSEHRLQTYIDTTRRRHAHER